MKIRELKEQQIDYDLLYELWQELEYADRKEYGLTEMIVQFDAADNLRAVSNILPDLHQGMQHLYQAEELINRGKGEFRTLVDELGGADALKKLARRHNVAQKRQQRE